MNAAASVNWEPSQIGGPLYGIVRAQGDQLARWEDLLSHEDPATIAAAAEMMRQVCPIDSIAVVFSNLAQLYAEFALLALVGPGDALVPEELRLEEIRILPTSKYFKEALEACMGDGMDFYREMGCWVLTRLWEYMSDELRRDTGPLGYLIVCGGFQSTRTAYIAARSVAEYNAALERCMWSAVKAFAHTTIKSFGFMVLPLRALEWFVGRREEEDWFLAGEAAIAAHRNDVARLEQLRCQWGQPEFYDSRSDPKMNYFPPRFSSKDDDRRFSLALATVSSTSAGWHTADNPIGWLIDSAWRELREQQQADESEFAKAHKCGITLTEVDDLKVAEAGYESLENLAANTIPELFDLKAALLEEVNDITDPAAVLRVYEARRVGTKWESIPEADRSKYRRAESTIRKLIAREAIWRAVPESRYPRDASESVYNQRFYVADRLLSTHAHVHDTPEKLQALKDVLSEERVHLTGKRQ